MAKTRVLISVWVHEDQRIEATLLEVSSGALTLTASKTPLRAEMLQRQSLKRFSLSIAAGPAQWNLPVRIEHWAESESQLRLGLKILDAEASRSLLRCVSTKKAA